MCRKKRKNKKNNKKIRSIFYGWLWTWVPKFEGCTFESFFWDLRDHFWGGPQQIPQTLHSSPSSKFTSSLLHSQRGLQHLLNSFYLIKRFPMKCCKITSGTTHPTDLVWFLSAAKERLHRFTSHIPCPRWHFDQQFCPSHLSALGVRRLMRFFLKPTSNTTNIINILCCHFQPFSIFTPHTWKPWRKLRATPRSTLNAGRTTPWTCDPWTNLVQNTCFSFKPSIFLNPVGRGWNIELPFANFYLESCVPHCPMGQVVIKFQSASLGSPTPLNFLHSGTFPTYPPAVEHGHGKVIYKWLYLQRKVILHSKLLNDQRIPALVEPPLGASHICVTCSSELVLCNKSVAVG
jgi:hypothetical protein